MYQGSCNTCERIGVRVAIGGFAKLTNSTLLEGQEEEEYQRIDLGVLTFDWQQQNM